MLEHKDSVVIKSINLIDLIITYNITDNPLTNEKKRGYTLEELNKRIIQNKQKKNKYKSYMAGNNRG